ncbi:MAG: (deoxy)nucleoside triphosphate pyrophosphohydrolase [Alphaproteobacteria bacterium]
MNKPIIVVACVINKGNKILISSRPAGKDFYGFFEFPGGKVKSGEYLMEALHREIFEELGINLKLNKILFLNNYRVYQRKKMLSLNFFFCDSWLGKIKNNENQLVEWVTLKELRSFKILSSNKNFLIDLPFLIFPSAN